MAQKMQIPDLSLLCRTPAAHDYFGIERTVDYYLANYPETRHHFCRMTRPQLQQLAAAGMTIGAHSLSHPVLSQMSQNWPGPKLRRAARNSRRRWVADSVTPRVAAIAKRAGFDAAFMNIGGGLGTELPPPAIPRVPVNAGMTLSEFEAHVSGF
jgi:hypothetical protein